MKKLRFTLASVITAGLFFASCSNDDHSPAATLEDRWTPTKTITIVNGNQTVQNYDENEPGCDKDYREFLEGGVYRHVINYKNTSNICTEDALTRSWARNGDQLIIADDNDPNTPPLPSAGTYEITKLTGSELRYKSTVNSEGVEVEVTRVFRRQ